MQCIGLFQQNTHTHQCLFSTQKKIVFIWRGLYHLPSISFKNKKISFYFIEWRGKTKKYIYSFLYVSILKIVEVIQTLKIFIN